MLVGSLFALGNGISLMFYAEPLGKLVAAFAPNKDTSEIVADALSAMKSFAFNSIIVFLNSWIMSTAWMYTSERQSSRARKAYFESLLRQEMTWHDRNKPE